LLTDEMLTAITLSGDISAFEKLIDRYKNSVFAVVYRMTGQYQEAEDISQEVFITVYTKLYQFDNSKKFAPWIHRIAINTCISSMRRNNKAVLVNFDESYIGQEHLNYQYNFGNPQILVENNELRADIRAALRELPETYQAVLILRYQLDLDNQEIADTMGLSKAKIEVTIHRARKALRKTLITRYEERRKQDELPGI